MEEFTSLAAGRLDQILAGELDITRSKAQKIIQGEVSVNGKKANKAGFEVEKGDRISYLPLKTEPLSLKEEDIPLDIIYEDSDILVVNKPRGMVVHPANGHHEGTLANALAYRFNRDEDNEDDDFRMGIVHRIDKDTSGLLVVAKNEEAKAFLTGQLSEHLIKREYLALARGQFKDRLFKIDAPIGRDSYNRQKMAVTAENGKRAVTHFEVLAQYKKGALLKCSLETGRTHQIRVHLAFIGHPIIGDMIYGSHKDSFAGQGQLLHAYKLTLTHPRTKKEMTFYAPGDGYFKKALIAVCQED